MKLFLFGFIPLVIAGGFNWRVDLLKSKEPCIWLGGYFIRMAFFSLIITVAVFFGFLPGVEKLLTRGIPLIAIFWITGNTFIAQYERFDINGVVIDMGCIKRGFFSGVVLLIIYGIWRVFFLKL